MIAGRWRARRCDESISGGTMMMEIQTVSVELLRAGPRHNQLVSPTTRYLGVCGNAPAGVVTLPYEHGELEDRLRELQYAISDASDPQRRLRMLDRIGREVARLLASIPGVTGLLNPKTERSDTMTHLRIVLSASELAMLPFEASKLPREANPGAVWLALQSRAPVCITRHIRSVSSEGMAWPRKPRVLFVAGPATPVQRHEAALRTALHPWRGPDESLSDRLVILERATLGAVSKALLDAAVSGKPITHVHILAHGAPLDAANPLSAVGLALDEDHVVSGQRLASALVSVSDAGVGRPLVVTLATCDSGRVTDVRTTDATIAHDLHDQGIPLVVASQFPLSKDGSVPLVQTFYEGQFRGRHPLVSLYQVRRQLHTEIGHRMHDWASLVVYEAFPPDMDARLEELSYWQARDALEGALLRLEREDILPGKTTPGPIEAAQAEPRKATYGKELAEVAEMIERLPMTGAYRIECIGLGASAHKRIAQVNFELAGRLLDAPTWQAELRRTALDALYLARSEYWRATRAYMGSWGEPGRKKSTLHWLLGQVLSLDLVLGNAWNAGLAAAAAASAEIDRDDGPTAEDRAWAEVSLAELQLMRLAGPQIDAAERRQAAAGCLAHAQRILALVDRDSEQVRSTARQFKRYTEWWNHDDFLASFQHAPDRGPWRLEGGLVAIAEQVVRELVGARAPATSRPRRAAAAAPPPPAPSPAPIVSASDASLLGQQTRFEVEMLPAANGDCLWIEYGDPGQPRRLLIDCGSRSASDLVAQRIKAGDGKVELFILTHIDADHINGVLPLFKDHPDLDGRFHDIWFNGFEQLDSPLLSVKQGDAFSRLLKERRLPWNVAFTDSRATTPAPVVVPAHPPLPQIKLGGGMTLTLLSPGPRQLLELAEHWQRELANLQRPELLGGEEAVQTAANVGPFNVAALADVDSPEDKSVANGSSIAVLAEFAGRSILLTGDAHAGVLVESIRALQRSRGQAGKPLPVTALKLSHHGSANATTRALLDAIDCRHYLVPTNGNMFNHPHPEAIARVIRYGGTEPALYFNYRSAKNLPWASEAMRTQYRYEAHYPLADAPGLKVDLLALPLPEVSS